MNSVPAKTVCLIVGLFCAVVSVAPALSESVFSAGYQINLVEGDDQWEVQTVAQTPKHEPIEHQFGQYLFSMKIESVSEEEFSLLLDVKKRASGLGTAQSILTHEFTGTFGAILEFEASNEFLEAKGAISVGVIER
jgi:hypothetical protein